MIADSLQSFLSFMQAHPWLAYSSVFIIALTESLALVGLVVPGAILMFAIGTLVTTGYLDFTYTVIWAVLGAISGDGLSYWLGHRYRNQLQNLWPLSRYPGAFDKGIAFFKHHGGKSILFGRFVGPLRPIIPAIAGMFGMPLRQFMLINILSGIAWAPLYLLPGMAFGLSLELAGEVAGRLVLWILALIISALLVIWLARHMYSYVLHHIEQWVEKLLHWSHRHPTTGQIPSALLEPMQSESRGLAWLTLLFLFSIILLTALTELAAGLGTVKELEQLVSNLPSFIRSPIADMLFGFFVSLSQPLALSLFACAITSWLLLQRQWLLVTHFLFAWLLPVIAIATLSFITSGTIFNLSHSPENLILISSLIFFLALLFGNEIRHTRRATFYAAIAIVLFLIFMAQLYWQQSSFIRAGIDVVLGLSWAALIGIAYRRHLTQQKTHYKIFPILAVLIFCGWATQHQPSLKTDHTYEAVVWSQQDWQESLWRTLPGVREDLRQSHQHPFNLQWQSNQASIAQQLRAKGWQESRSISWRTLLNSLQSAPEAMDLFILPHIHHGRYENQRWTKYQNNQLYVLRLWKSYFRVSSQESLTDLWFGNISIMQKNSQFGWHYLQTSMQFKTALSFLRSDNLRFSDKGNVLLLSQ